MFVNALFNERESESEREREKERLYDKTPYM
jgi:hypothetical protein